MVSPPLLFPSKPLKNEDLVFAVCFWEDVMTEGLRGQYQVMTHKQKDRLLAREMTRGIP